VLELDGLLTKARAESTCSNKKVMSMKTVVRIVKRGSEDKKDECSSATPTNRRLTTEMIVKSWIIESREHRRNGMSQLQSLLGWKELASG